MLFDMPTANCDATAPAGTSIRIGYSASARACSTAAGGDPLPAIEGKVQSLVERIRTGGSLSNSEQLALETVRNSVFTFAGAVKVVDLFIATGPGERFTYWTQQSKAPDDLVVPIELRKTVSEGIPAAFHWWCVGSASLRNIWDTLLKVADYQGDMAAYRQIWSSQ